MGSLSNLYISQSYQSLIHLATNNTASATLIGLQDGLGNSIGVSVNTGGNLYLSGSLSASLLQGYTLVGDATNRTALVATSSFGGATPAGTISSSAQITALGFVSSSVTASSLITASFSGNTLTFTKGNGTTFGVVIPDVSGSTINTGSFVTTSSFNQYTSSTDNRLNNLESTSASVNISISNLNTYTQSNDAKWNTLGGQTGSYVTSAITASSLITASVNLNTITFTKGDASTFNITVNTGSGGGGGTISVQDEGTILGNATSFNFNGAGVTATLSAGTASITIPGGGGSIDTGSFLTTGSFNTSQNVKGAINFYPTGSTAGQAIRIYNTGSNPSGSMILGITDPGSPFISLQQRTWFQIQGSDDLNYVNFTASFDNGLGIGPNFGSRTQMLTTSGSLVLFNPTIARARVMTNYSASTSAALNGINLVFNNNTNNVGTIISGSNNIFVNPTTPTAGFVRYVGTSGNVMLNQSNVPQISGSMAFSPTINNNYFGGNSVGLTMRGPVSSSAWTISANSVLGTINIGSSAALHAEKLVSGLTMTGNSIAGTLSIVANQSALSSSVSFTNNIIAGTATLNFSSSAAAMASNIINDNSFVLTNQFYTGSLGVGSVALNRCNIGGAGHTITISGSLPAGTTTQPSISDNFIFGGTNTIYIDVQNARVSGSNAYMSAIRTGLMGNQLIVSGSSLLTDLSSAGSVFVGRYNADDNRRNKTSDVVFAVGTGNSTTRKTGFLIDSGSNSSFEGSLTVSGSTTLSGSLTIQSGSAFFANGNRQFNVGAFQSNISQSGSANVSQSMNFEQTDISSGISIVSNSRITLANSGTYNIQFSAQAIATGGADNLYIWLKKNGTNVTASAGNVEIANNAEVIAAWNYVVNAAAGDYFELCWQAGNTDTILLAAAASGNIPSIPSIILTVTQVR